MKSNIFVYGTLRSGESNSKYLKNSLYISPDYIEGFEIIDLGDYPMAFETGIPGDKLIIEVYEVDDITLERIDELEEFNENNPDSLYKRKTVISKSGIKGLIYYGDNRESYKHFNKIKSGDWKKRKN